MMRELHRYSEFGSSINVHQIYFHCLYGILLNQLRYRLQFLRINLCQSLFAKYHSAMEEQKPRIPSTDRVKRLLVQEMHVRIPMQLDTSDVQ